MARPIGMYSRVVAWLKILLPLAALALLSTIFLLSDSREPIETVPFADALLDGGTTREGVSAPYYAGTTARGDVLTMTARRAVPHLDGQIVADEMQARMQLAVGGEILLDAVTATLSDAEDSTLLEGGVRIESSTGYVLTTDAMRSAIDRIEADSLGPVRGEGPLGTLEAGKMQIRPTGEGDEVQMLFTDGVKLIYQPPDKESAAE